MSDPIEAIMSTIAPTYWRQQDEATQQFWLINAGDVLRAIEEAGWAVVPKEPTPEMLDAGRKVNALVDGNALGLAYIAPEPAWDAMLEAAPRPWRSE